MQDSGPDGGNRTRQALTLAFLAVQLGVPLAYYVVRDSAYDERFAWRMFSPTRMVDCRAQFLAKTSEAGEARPLRLSREISEPWIRWIRRGHVRVARAFAAHWCGNQGPGATLEVTLVCGTPDGGREELLSGEELCQK